MSTVTSTWLLGLGGASRLAQSVLAFVATPMNTLILAVGGEPLSLTVTAPARSAGTTVFAPADLSTGPVDIVAPSIEAAPQVGQATEAIGAIWAYDGAQVAPALSWQWRSDGTDIPGATQSSYIPTASDAGVGLSVVETATGTSGARSVASAELTVSP